MKASIIYFGIALGTFTNVALALNHQQKYFNSNFVTPSVLGIKNLVVHPKEDHSRERVGGKDNGIAETSFSDVLVFNPYEKTVQEVIAEDNLIIENAISGEENFSFQQNFAEANLNLNDFLSENSPCYTEQSIEKVITEDSKIIESIVLPEAVQTKL